MSDRRDGAPEAALDAEDAADSAAAGSADAASPDGGHAAAAPSTHTVRLELVDEPGQLLAALHPIADNGGNLLSIYHERGNKTPRGRIP
ncbi:amino acid-binding protein, partial [Haloarcula sp. AONF1]